ncbi:MAG TPA: ABC transporter permease/substrate-binding protein [Gemmataceae bacterium]|nr:ABC transporter permease/substrate-binding protein [Gemmataceae bacterium]
MSEQLAECFRDLPDYLSGHLLLSLSALVVGLAFSVPLGIAVSRRPKMSEWAQGVAAVIQTVPSLALLVLMVPLLGGRTGFWPAFAALVLYSILPILANTVIGLRGVDPILIEAGRGLGMSDRELLRKVQLPLAAPVILGGVRTATVLVVGTATLATPVGGMSLGNYIFGGLETSDYVATVFGCVLAAVMAVVMDQLVRLFELAAQNRNRRLAWIGAFAVLLLLGIALYGPLRKFFAPAPAYIAGASFTEQHILSEVMKEKLRSAGFTVNQRKGMAEGVQFLALRGNQIDCCINYTGNIWTVLMKEKEAAERPILRARVRQFLRQHYGVTCLGELGFENAYALAMNPKRAEELLGSDKAQWTVSGLAKQTRRFSVSVSGDLQFFRRPEWRRLRDRYELRFREKIEADPTLMYGAIRDGRVDAIVAYTSDGRIEKYGLVLLQDDLGVLPSYDAILLVSAKAAVKPGFLEALNPLVGDGGAINDAAMQEANRQVDVEGKSPRWVALQLLEVISARQKKQGRR